MNPTKPPTLAELLAMAKQRKEGKVIEPLARSLDPMQSAQEVAINPEPIKPDYSTITVHDSHGIPKTIHLNDKQSQFVELVASGKSCILIGAAGTGKTTCTQAALQAVIDSGLAGILQGGHKHLTAGTPAIIPTAYTRRATNNIRRVMSKDLAANTITIHKLLEYSPVFYEVMDEYGKLKKTMRFEALRNAANQLDRSIRIIVVDESSMLSVQLYNEIEQALGHSIIWVFIGDLNQLPPVFGLAILGFKLLELPVVELTEVYRQALESPIISLAHRVLSGKGIDSLELKQKWQYQDQLQVIQWPKYCKPEVSLFEIAKLLKAAYDAGKYDPETDIILTPHNKGVGQIELNKHIAEHIARKLGRVTYEIIAGYTPVYYSVGDKVLYDKEDSTIIAITPNTSYFGRPYATESTTLSYWGFDNSGTHYKNTDIDLDAMLAGSSGSSDDDKTLQASHCITIEVTDSGEQIELTTLGQIKELSHAYAMTVHKSQGSEWRRVFLCLHHTHYNLNREMLYTAITRASKQLVIICEQDSFIKGVRRQAIKGNSLEEKAEFFKGKQDSKEAMQ